MNAAASMDRATPAGQSSAMVRDAFANIPETSSHKDRSLHRVVIVGGGSAGLELATRLGRKFGRRARASITLVDRNRTHIWKPLLHEVASGSLNPATDSVEYIAHAARHHYRYRIGQVVGIDRANRQVFVAPSFGEEGKQVIPPRVLGYDTLVLAVGSVCNDFGTPGAAQHAIALDDPEQASRFNRRMIDACLRANAQREQLSPGQLHCAIIGAGATGVELAAELHKSMREIAAHNLDNIDFERLIRITLIEAGPRILPALPEHLSRDSAQLLVDLGAQIRCGAKVTEVTADGVKLGDKLFLPAELVVWSAGIKAPDFLRSLDGLETDRINRIVVGETLKARGDDNVFAIGDCANCVLPSETSPLPPRAQTAHQQADHLVKVIAARLKGRQLPAFRYRYFGSLVSLADYRTFGNVIGGLKIEGLVAKLMYRALYRMHLQAVHGTFKTGLDTIAAIVAGRAKPLSARALPGEVVFVGGGVIAFELGHVYARAGVKVTILEALPQLLGGVDADAVDQIRGESQRIGMSLLTLARVKSIEQVGRRLRVLFASDGVDCTIDADSVVNCAGRIANVEAIDLDAGQVAHCEGRIDVDEFLRSRSNPNVYVCGDALWHSPQLSPVATYEGRVVGRNIVEGAKHRPDYGTIPNSVYTVPTVASVGLTEATAKEQGLAVKVHVNDMRGWLSARTYAETAAWSKIIVDAASDRVLGAHIVGHAGEELIHIFALAMRHGITAKDLADSVFAFPTFSADIKNMM
jgi:NADH dehydrogenase